MSRLTVDQVTIEWLSSVTKDEFVAALRGRGMGDPVLTAVNNLLQTPEGSKIAAEMANDPDYVPVSKRTPSEEEQEQINADLALANEQEAVAAAAAQAAEVEQSQVLDAYQQTLGLKIAAEDQLAVKYGLQIVRDQYGHVERVIHDYQVTDEDGRPLGRPTHFESANLVEAIVKVQNAHVNAVRYAERAKSNRVKASAANLTAVEKNEAVKSAKERSERLAAEAVNEKDPSKMKQAVEASIQAEREAKEAEAAQREHGATIAQTWMADHVHDFLPSAASSQIMGEYMVANGLSMSYENLQTAFEAVKDRLPKPPVQVVEAVSTTPAINPPVVVPVTQTEVATETTSTIPTTPVVKKAVVPVPVSPAKPVVAPQTSATAPTSTPVTANQPTVTRKSGVNGGLQPGSMSAARPTVEVATPEQTRATLLGEIGKMAPEVFRKKLSDPKFVAQLRANGIPVLGRP